MNLILWKRTTRLGDAVGQNQDFFQNNKIMLYFNTLSILYIKGRGGKQCRECDD